MRGWIAALHSERGGATVLTIAACAVVLSLGIAALLVAAAAQASATARSAADLGALAGATVLMDRLRGEAHAEPCAAAAAVVARNGAVQESCALDDGVNVTVRARVDLAGPVRTIPGLSAARATARAGPATEREGLR